MIGKRISSALVAAAVALLAASCSSGGSTASTTTAAVTTTLVKGTTTTTGAAASSTSQASTAPTSTVPTTVAAAVDAVGTVSHHDLVTADGRTRTYRLYVPTKVAADAPLLVALHGGTGNGDQFARASGYDGLAEANGFVVVYPEGIATAIGPRNLVWNAGGCCAIAQRENVDDVAFLRAVIDQVGADQHLDVRRVLFTGHSNGAMMSLRFACEAADRVAAVAVQSGTVFVDDCTPSEPVSVLQIHGDADTHVPLDGGVGEDSVVGADFPPVREGLARFAAADHCPRTTPAVDDTEVPGATATVSVESWGPCPDGTAVQLDVVAGAGHSWMTTASAGFDSSLTAWQFLANHR